MNRYFFHNNNNYYNKYNNTINREFHSKDIISTSSFKDCRTQLTRENKLFLESIGLKLVKKIINNGNITCD